MKLGLIGLGRMGANMARRLRGKGIDVVGYNRDLDVTRALAKESGIAAAESVAKLVAALPAPPSAAATADGGLLTQAPPNTGAGWYSLSTGAWPGAARAWGVSTKAW